MMPPRIAKFAAMGAFGAVALFVLLFVVIVIAAAPRRTGGIDIVQATVTWISVGIAILALIALHIVLARGLLDYSRGRRRTV
jgi:heme exporter protein D